MVTKLVEFAVILFVSYVMAVIITYCVVCVIETLQKLNNKRR